MVDLRKTGSSARFFNKLQKQKKKREKSSSGEGDKGAKREQKGAKREPHVSVAGFSNMSSEEDVPAPSPSAAVVARRAGREAKSMREESGSDTDAEEPEEWDDDGEASSDEGESDEEARVSNAQRGRVRLHGVSQSSNGLEVDDDRRKSLGEKGCGTPGGCGAWCGAEWYS